MNALINTKEISLVEIQERINGLPKDPKSFSDFAKFITFFEDICEPAIREINFWGLSDDEFSKRPEINLSFHIKNLETKTGYWTGQWFIFQITEYDGENDFFCSLYDDELDHDDVLCEEGEPDRVVVKYDDILQHPCDDLKINRDEVREIVFEVIKHLEWAGFIKLV